MGLHQRFPETKSLHGHREHQFTGVKIDKGRNLGVMGFDVLDGGFGIKRNIALAGKIPVLGLAGQHQHQADKEEQDLSHGHSFLFSC
jgi:hypothetical protein